MKDDDEKEGKEEEEEEEGIVYSDYMGSGPGNKPWHGGHGSPDVHFCSTNTNLNRCPPPSQAQYIYKPWFSTHLRTSLRSNKKQLNKKIKKLKRILQESLLKSSHISLSRAFESYYPFISRFCFLFWAHRSIKKKIKLK